MGAFNISGVICELINTESFCGTVAIHRNISVNKVMC